MILLYIVAAAVVCAVVMWRKASAQGGKVEWHHHPESQLVKELMSKTSLGSLHYTPHWFCVTNHIQCMFYILVYVNIHRIFFRLRYVREYIKLHHDKATIAIDWHERPPAKKDTKPILLLLPGIGATSQNSTMTKIINEAKSEFHCAFVWPRCKGDTPVDSDKIFCFASWRDVKDLVDQTYDTHCRSQGRDIYLFAVSLGACAVTHYLIKEGAASPVKAVSMYAAPLDVYTNRVFWKQTANGLYDKFVSKGYLKAHRHALEKIAANAKPALARSYAKVLNS